MNEHDAYVSLNREDILQTLIRLALAEDVGGGDWTTRWTIPAEATGAAMIVAKSPSVVSGTGAASAVFQAVDPRIAVNVLRGDAESVGRKQAVMEVAGPLRSILTAERVALNFLGHLSGIATLTRAFVRAVEGTRARIVDTRKTTPGYRLLEKDAVRHGGGMNHRAGLHDMVLIKDNHIAAAGGVREALDAVERQNTKGLPVEVEVRTMRELERVLKEPPDRILLDNMSIRDMTEAVYKVSALGARRPELEASGNVTLGSVASIAGTGVDLISVGALTHSAPTADLSLQLAL
ncbi:MAG TPA: carboxylating nicotinate-nucleotide diphosphorylase [Longimicrobiales bacterium]|nr:carboxylating nicotinate-nucleotide diphosphorylase [Longimicrobiales bacterium]